MTTFRRGICYLLLLMCINSVLLLYCIPGTAAAVVTGIFLTVFYFCLHIAALWDNAPLVRLRILNGGYELILAVTVCFTAEIPLYIYLHFSVPICRGRRIFEGLCP